MNNDCFAIITTILNIIGWLAATAVGAAVGFYSNHIMSRRTNMIHVRGRILAILDAAPQDAYDAFDAKAVEDLRTDFFAAVAHLGEQDQAAACKKWDALKQIPCTPINDREALMMRFKQFLGDDVETPTEAFHRTMRELEVLFYHYTRNYMP